MNEIIQFLSGIGISDYVTSEKEIAERIEGSNTYHTHDARSAAFYAFGKANRENKPVALIINGEFLPNVYTAVTEAWFQKTRLVIAAIYDKYSSICCGYMDRCVINNIITDKNDIYNIATKDLLVSGPVLLNIFGVSLNKREFQYTEVLNCLNAVADKGTEVFCYSSNNDDYINLNIKSIDVKHKYGMLSKYWGYTIAAEKKTILCCSAGCIALDMNIFNSRYTTENIKIIVIDREGIINNNNIDKWIESNNITCRIINAVTIEDIKSFYNEKCASVLVIRKEMN